jgi:hypothetical protein
MGRNSSQPRRLEPARACDEALTALLAMEAFQAYRGTRALDAINERAAGGDALATARRVQRVASVLLRRSDRNGVSEWADRDPQHESRVDGDVRRLPLRASREVPLL